MASQRPDSGRRNHKQHKRHRSDRPVIAAIIQTKYTRNHLKNGQRFPLLPLPRFHFSFACSKAGGGEWPVHRHTAQLVVGRQRLAKPLPFILSIRVCANSARVAYIRAHCFAPHNSSLNSLQRAVAAAGIVKVPRQCLSTAQTLALSTTITNNPTNKNKFK